MGDFSHCKQNLVIVTGFGPFAGHEKVNASWEAVRRLPDTINVNQIDYEIEKIHVPVIYEEVDRTIEAIWKRQPKLVIHCGVHGSTQFINLEKNAYNNKFCKADYSGRKLSCSRAPLTNNGSCSDNLSTNLDIEQMTDELNLKHAENTKKCEMFRYSVDVGDYLCGYIYLKSLDMNCANTLFIHVPPVDKPFTSQETSDAIFEVIGKCLLQDGVCKA